MEITGTTALVTGANRGLGRALLTELLDRGAARVYAAVRDPHAELPDDSRVVRLVLDLDDRDSITAAAAAAPDVRLLVNNAGIAAFADALTADRDAVEREMRTNYLGLLDVLRAFAPVLPPGGAVLNVLTLLSFAGMPTMAGYAASKSAAHNLTQSVRPAFAARGVTVHGAYPGGIDTDMLAGVEAPKSPPTAVAAALLDGVETGQEEIFPDPMSQQMAELLTVDRLAFAEAFADLAAGA